MNLQHRLNELFDDHPGRTVRMLSEATGIKKGAIYEWRKGKVKTMYGNNPYLVAEFFGCNVEWLVRGMGEKYPNAPTDNSKVPNKDIQNVEKNTLENVEMASTIEDARNMQLLNQEDTMYINLVGSADQNISKGIALLENLDNAIDKDKQIIKAMQIMSLSCESQVDIVVHPKPPIAPKPKKSTV